MPSSRQVPRAPDGHVDKAALTELITRVLVDLIPTARHDLIRAGLDRTATGARSHTSIYRHLRQHPETTTWTVQDRAGAIKPPPAALLRLLGDLADHDVTVCVPRCADCGSAQPTRPAHEQGARVLCRSCRPRRESRCAGCGRVRRILANWPLGPVCGACYARTRRHPSPCASCDRQRPLIGVDAEGRRLCGPCADAPTLAYTCPRCGRCGFANTRLGCVHCEAVDRMRVILGDTDGNVPSDLQSLALVIASAPSDDALLARLRPGSAAVAVAEALRDTGRPLSHELLNELPPSVSMHWLRNALIAADVLPPRDEYLERITAWLDAELVGHAPSAANLLLGYAHWWLLRRARSRARRTTATTPSAAEALRAQLRAAIALMCWLDDQNLQLDTINQEALDVWICRQSPTMAGNAQGFVTWLRQRHVNNRIAIPTRQSRSHHAPLTEAQRCTHLDRCLHDTALPSDVRAAGALMLVYGVPLTRIARLRQQDLRTDDHGSTHLRMPPNPPVQLPSSLARLLLRQCGAAAAIAVPSVKHDSAEAWLFPGGIAGQPTVVGLARKLRNHLGVSIRQARSAALLSLATQLPPAVLAPVAGLHVRTATAWTDLVGHDWSSYLEARTSSAGQYCPANSAP